MSRLKPFVRSMGLVSIGIACFSSAATIAATRMELSSAPLIASSHPSLAMNDNVAIDILATHTDAKNVTHVRFQQMYDEYPVWGADSIAHLPATHAKNLAAKNLIATIKSAPGIDKNGVLFANLAKDIGTAQPKKFDAEIPKQNAIAKLTQLLSTRDPNHAFTYSEEEAKVIVYVDDNNIAHTAFLVSLLATADDQIPKRPAVIMDAQDYTVYKEWNQIQTEFSANKLVPAETYGFGGNPLSGQVSYGKSKPALKISRDEATNTCYMTNPDVDLLKKDKLENKDNKLNRAAGTPFSFNCVKNPTNIYKEPEGGYYGQFNKGYSPINDALHTGMVIKSLYKDWYDITVLTQRDKVTPLQLSFNLLYLQKRPFENAFWDDVSKKMFFGLGGTDLYPLVTLSVAAHEVSHGFTAQHSNLLYMDQSGGLNESFSDMASAAASYYDSNMQKTDWMIGGDIVKQNLNKPKEEYVAIRFIDHPARDGMSIEHVKDYDKLVQQCKKLPGSATDPDMLQSCIVHFASGLFNKVYYQLSTSPGWTPKSAFAVMVKANQDYWTAHEKYETAACGVKKAALDLATDAKEVEKTVTGIYAGVGISLKSCK